MRHGPEKSDPAIVAMKPANNSGRSEAESVERRAGAKGNTGKTRTHFKHVCGVDRGGRFAVIRIPSVRSCRKFLARVHEWLLQHMHWSRREQQSHLRAMLQGFYQYFGLHHCNKKLSWIH